MKRVLGVLVLFLMGISESGYGYQRFTYIDCGFTVSGQNTPALLDDLVYTTIECNKKPVTYSVQNTESRRDFVYLSRVDKWRIARVLRMYNPVLPLTSTIINEIVASLGGKRKIIIQHVLHDFLKNPNSTIESVLQVLQDNRVS